MLYNGGGARASITAVFRLKQNGGNGMAKANILFADNDLDFLKTRSDYLEREGYRVIPATDLSEVRRRLEGGGIDLAILDIRLRDDDDDKDTSGLTLAKEVARLTPKIILTGFPSVDAVRVALTTQLDGLPAAVDFVGKAEGPKALVRAIQRALELGVPIEGTETSALRGEGSRTQVRLAGGVAAIIALLLAMGAGIVAIVTGDPRWLLATVFLAVFVVVGAGLAVFIPE